MTNETKELQEAHRLATEYLIQKGWNISRSAATHEAHSLSRIIPEHSVTIRLEVVANKKTSTTEKSEAKIRLETKPLRDAIKKSQTQLRKQKGINWQSEMTRKKGEQ